MKIGVMGGKVVLAFCLNLRPPDESGSGLGLGSWLGLGVQVTVGVMVRVGAYLLPITRAILRTAACSLWRLTCTA